MAAVLEQRQFPKAHNIHSLPYIESGQPELGPAVPGLLPRGRAGFSIGIVDSLAERVVALQSEALLEWDLRRVLTT